MRNLVIKKDSACLSVVIPVFNEERTLAKVVKKLLRLPILLEIIIVDDCSTDETANVALNLSEENEVIKYIRQPRNRGKSQALKTGFGLTIGDIVIVQHADLEYDRADIPEVIAPIIEGFAYVVYGSRFMVKRAARVLYFYHYLANKGFTFISNLLTNLKMTMSKLVIKSFAAILFAI